MTNNENTETHYCYYCQNVAQSAKIEDIVVEYTEDDEIHTKEIFPICYNCEDAEYDGTEVYPGTVSLSRLAG